MIWANSALVICPAGFSLPDEPATYPALTSAETSPFAQSEISPASENAVLSAVSGCSFSALASMTNAASRVMGSLGFISPAEPLITPIR